METALSAANWLLGKLLNKLSDDLIAGFVASRELGLNFGKIKDDLNYTLGLLHAAEGRDVTDNPGLRRLLDDLSMKADEAEDALDELHYFMIQDQLDGTQEATAELGDGLGDQAQHVRHAVRHNAGNWFSCFPCCRSQDDVAVVTTDNTHNTSKAMVAVSDIEGSHVDKLQFDRVAMSNKIKQIIEDMHSKCSPISDLLKINPSSSLRPIMPASTKRSHTSSVVATETGFFGREEIFEKTINEITNAGHKGETLSVLPIVGPGGIGKTTFTQYLYNDKRTEKCFAVRVWICVSTNFDVLKLSKEILSCLPATENEGNKIAKETDNLDSLQNSIAERLKSKRFLIVLDDVWECSSNDEWEKLLAPFKKGDTSGSKILVTTRFPRIVQIVKKAADPIELHGLEPDEFWKFFQVCVFGEIPDEHGKEDLIGIARQIADKLKCSPLAAKTVGRLLSKKPSLEHWMEIFQNKQWLKQKHGDDIIPALKISYDYLPFHLKKCFSYCALFPEDYMFDSLEIGRFWISMGFVDSSSQNDKIEDIGSTYLDELVDNGFLMKGHANYYVMHDLMHDLSQTVSSKECAYISNSSFRAHDIPFSIRHLSISMQNKYVENFEEEMNKLKKRINIRNLRSLMIFGRPNDANANILKDTFEGVKCLRVLFIFMNSPSSLPHNFSKLIHLQYLKMGSPWSRSHTFSLPSVLSRFYHLKFLDIQEFYGSFDLPKDISRLVNLRHFVAKKEFHSNVPRVGQMKFLQELKEFHVKKEIVGFELWELGKLEELGGKLCISGLENVKTCKEANEAKLVMKRNLIKLKLVWGGEQLSMGHDILENLRPHSDLRGLSIVNHGNATGPSWLCSNMFLKNLETLRLEGVSWAILPAFGQMYHLRKLKLQKIVGICQFVPDFFGGVTEKSFTQLMVVELVDMPELVEWVGGAKCHLFSRLERISCVNCPKLTALLFSGCSSSSTQDNNTIWFPNLCSLYIKECPKLCLPPLPHTSKLSSFHTDYLDYSGTSLLIRTSGGLDLDNLGEVQELSINDASLISLTDLKKLHSLRSMDVSRCQETTMFGGLDDGVMLQSVQSLSLNKASLSGNSLSKLLQCFPALSNLDVTASDEDLEDAVLQFPPSSSLRVVSFESCKNLILPIEDGSGFQGLLSLESVKLEDCGKLFSRWSMGEAAQSNKPFPPCLKKLHVYDEQRTLSMALLSNLTSLTSLQLIDCKNSSVDGFNPLITCYLQTLTVLNGEREDETDPYSIAADLLGEVARIKTMPAGFFRLVELRVDSISAVLVAPICSRLSATLKTLYFFQDWRVESFTEVQEQALQLLTSLQHLSFFYCRGLQSLPQGLHRLPSLGELTINGLPKIRSLPNEGLPDALRHLSIAGCCAELQEECKELQRTRPNLDVYTGQPSEDD